MFSGKITLITRDNDKTGVQQVVRQLKGILHCQLQHQQLIVLYNPQSITYDRILETTLQAGYPITSFFVVEEEVRCKTNSR